MRTESNIGDLLFGKVRGGILAYLYAATTGSRFFTRQIARQINTSIGTVHRELETLTSAQLLSRQKIGNLVFYSANEEHPLFPELRSIIAKTFGAAYLLSDALQEFTGRIEFAFLYGSFARGDENARSDIDLMVIGSVGLDDLLEKLAPIEASLQRPINPSIYSPEELRTKLHAGHHFLTSIQQGKTLFLIGSEHEFREIR